MGARSWLKQRVSDYIDARHPEIEERARALAIRQNEYGYDPFGFSRDHVKFGAVAARWLYRNYFRVEAFGTEHVPNAGRALIVANHAGQLPYDGLMIGSALFLDKDPPRYARSMIEKFVPTVPFVSYALSRLGQITGTPENCRRLLEQEECILVFPEGARGISKNFSHRYELAPFGAGFMRLALETNTPVIPCAVIGSEEQAPAVNVKPLAKLLGTPAFPVVPYPPFFPIVPLPTKYRLHFGQPMSFSGDADDDDDVIAEQVRAVRNAIQSMVWSGLQEREHVFW